MVADAQEEDSRGHFFLAEARWLLAHAVLPDDGPGRVRVESTRGRDGDKKRARVQ